MKKEMEILAPAGSFESMMAGVNSGADAVYFGYGQFNARRNAKNFSEEDFAAMAAYCKARGVKMYMTLNTMVYDRELEGVRQTIAAACRYGVDAVLVQDLGVMRLLKELAPQIPLHASTQMAAHNVSGARKLYDMGFSRVVLAREMSAKEIAAVVQQVPVETEVFVHGALCMCLSGQCYMSSMIGERSGNRGLCAQPCRLPFTSGRGDDGYALSLKDLTLVDRMEQLKALGVSSLKIEGRMKRPEYVAAAVSGFRQAMAGQQPDMERLTAAFSRSGFTRGYFDGRIGLDMFGTRQHEDVLAGQKVIKQISAGLEKEYPHVPLDLTFVMEAGKPVTLTAADDQGRRVTVEGPVPEQAQNRPTTEELVRRSMEKTGGTFYFVRNVDCHLQEGLICPASHMNQLRRQALEELTALRSTVMPWPFEGEKQLPPQPKLLNIKIPQLRAQVRNWEQVTPELVQQCEKIIVPLDQLLEHQQEITPQLAEKMVASLPRLCFGDDEKELSPALQQLKLAGISHLATGNIGGVALGKQLGFTVHGQFSLNIANSLALKEYAHLGVVDTVVSYELSMARAKGLADAMPYGILAYGHLPLMVTRNCPIRLGGCKSCKGSGILTDRRGVQFPVSCTKRSYSEVFNGVPLYLADRKEELEGFSFLQLYFTGETPQQCNEILQEYTRPNGGRKRENITRGLYYRNVK